MPPGLKLCKIWTLPSLFLLQAAGCSHTATTTHPEMLARYQNSSALHPGGSPLDWKLPKTLETWDVCFLEGAVSIESHWVNFRSFLLELSWLPSKPLRAKGPAGVQIITDNCDLIKMSNSLPDFLQSISIPAWLMPPKGYTEQKLDHMKVSSAQSI